MGTDTSTGLSEMMAQGIITLYLAKYGLSVKKVEVGDAVEMNGMKARDVTVTLTDGSTRTYYVYENHAVTGAG